MCVCSYVVVDVFDCVRLDVVEGRVDMGMPSTHTVIASTSHPGQRVRPRTLLMVTNLTDVTN